MTFLAALLGAASVALLSSRALSRRGPPALPQVTLAHFDDASISRTLH